MKGLFMHAIINEPVDNCSAVVGDSQWKTQQLFLWEQDTHQYSDLLSFSPRLRLDETQLIPNLSDKKMSPMNLTHPKTVLFIEVHGYLKRQLMFSRGEVRSV